MTTTRYFIARVAQAFGIFRRNQRMGAAASEMHLLREAEAHLGMAVWEKVDSIERLSIEYWNLRKLIKDRERVIIQLAHCENQLETTHKERADLLSASPTPQSGLYDERLAVISALEELTQQRDHIVTEARDVRRIYDGLKIKIEVLTKEQSASPQRAAEFEKVKQRLAELKQQFVALKDQRTAVGVKIDEGDKQLDQIDHSIGIFKNERRMQASETFKAIGEANREISILRAELGLLDTRIRQIHGEIGRYVSRHSFNDTHCAETVKSHRGLVEVMRALRRSVALNHRLGGMS
jgi:predicted  nucleic acid-binding Zn-ribbon protein